MELASRTDTIRAAVATTAAALRGSNSNAAQSVKTPPNRRLSLRYQVV